MLAVWLFTFIAGVVAARTGSLLAVLASLVTLVGLFALGSPGRRWLVASLSAAAFAWGAAHAAPPPCRPVADVVVSGRNGLFPGSGPILVEAAGRRFEAYGLQDVALRGSLVVKPAPRLFAPCFAFFRASIRSPPRAATPFAVATAVVRDRVLEASQALAPASRAWLRSIVIGDKSRLPLLLTEAFRKTGLFHLLVVSGQHVTLVALLLSFVVRAPLQAAYALRLLAPGVWRHASSGLSLVVAIAALVYAAATGMSAASQRSALLFCVWQTTRVFLGALPTRQRLLIAAAAQSVFFPVGFLAEASLMSWCAYLIVICHARTDAASLRARLSTAFVTQVRLMVVTAGVFGQLSFVGLVANGLFVSLFTFVLGLGVAVVAWPGAPWAPLLVETQASFVRLLSAFSRLCDAAPWLSLGPAALSAPVRIGLAALASGTVLNTCRTLSISTYESHRERGPRNGDEQALVGTERGHHRR